MQIDTSETATGFQFNGNAKEWFGIWIVNLLLSIVTLGIYSAWAKVRTKKYFHNNTTVEGRSFDYHATGGQILKGRLIVIAAIVVFQVIVNTVPELGLILIVVFLIAFPWLVLNSIRFNASMTSFSNVRFNFGGTKMRTFLVFMVYPFLSALTLYTTFPWYRHTLETFMVDNHRLGTAKFTLKADVWPFYRAALTALGVALAVSVVVGGALIGSIASMLASESGNLGPFAIMNIGLIYVGLIFVILPAGIVFATMVRNIVYNGATLDGGHSFVSTLNPIKVLWIAVSNMIVTVLTLGLMLPWAHVRMAKYKASQTSVILGGSLDEFVGTETEKVSALGDAYGDIEGIDVGIAI